MPNFEYKVVPAPKNGLKAKGIKTVEDRFANALTTLMNELGAEGWQYQRSDTLPCEERSGLRGRKTNPQSMLVFRRAITALAPQAEAPQAQVSQPQTREAAPTQVADIAQQIAPAPRAPQLNAARSHAQSTAPALGAATDAVEVRDPRTRAPHTSIEPQ